MAPPPSWSDRQRPQPRPPPGVHSPTSVGFPMAVPGGPNGSTSGRISSSGGHRDNIPPHNPRDTKPVAIANPRPQTDHLLRTFRGHNQPGTNEAAAIGGMLSVSVSVRCVCPGSRDTVVTASEDTTLKLWDLVTAECLHTLRGHTDWVTSCCCSSNFETVLSGSADCSIRQWSLPHGECVRTFTGGCRVCLLSLQSLIWCVVGHHDCVWSICTLGNNLISSSADGESCCLMPAPGHPVNAPAAPTAAILLLLGVLYPGVLYVSLPLPHLTPSSNHRVPTR